MTENKKRSRFRKRFFIFKAICYRLFFVPDLRVLLIVAEVLPFCVLVVLVSCVPAFDEVWPWQDFTSEVPVVPLEQQVVFVFASFMQQLLVVPVVFCAEAARKPPKRKAAINNDFFMYKLFCRFNSQMYEIFPVDSFLTFGGS